MPSPLRARAFRTLAAVMLLVALLVPGSAPALGADDEPLVLRAGTDQDLQVLNPWLSTLVVDYEVYTLNYDLLVGFGPNLEPAPGFADEWESSADGMTHTFHIREGMTWSDGEPATCEDARWTYQLVLDSLETEYGGLGSYYLEPYLTNAGLESVICEGKSLVVTTVLPHHAPDAGVRADPAQAHLEPVHDRADPERGGRRTSSRTSPRSSGPGHTRRSSGSRASSFASFAMRATGANRAPRTRSSSRTSTRRAPWSRPFEERRGGLHPRRRSRPVRRARQRGEHRDRRRVLERVHLSLVQHQGQQRGLQAVRPRRSATSAFRDALGYALDRDRLVEATLAGHGVAGDTNIPPYHADWHVPPTTPRTFDLEEAARRLDAAGYKLDANNKRLDKEGKPITLRLTWPDSEEESATNAQFIQEWFGEIGITVDAAVTEEGKLLDDLLGPPDGEADWDFYMWGWVGDPDPMSLLSFFTSGQLGGLNDSFYSNPRYDELFELQQKATDKAQRHEYIAEMQQIFYDDAPYHVLYYDNELHAYRTDKFANWTNQPPEIGTPLFGYGPFGYTVLTGRQRSHARRRVRRPAARRRRRRAGRPARPRPSHRRTPPRPTRSRSSWAWSRSSRWSRSRSCSSAGAGRNRRKSDAGTGRQPSSCGDEPARPAPAA